MLLAKNFFEFHARVQKCHFGKNEKLQVWDASFQPTDAVLSHNSLSIYGFDYYIAIVSLPPGFYKIWMVTNFFVTYKIFGIVYIFILSCFYCLCGDSISKEIGAVHKGRWPFLGGGGSKLATFANSRGLGVFKCQRLELNGWVFLL